MIRVNAQIEIAEWEITENFTRASGPGGQHVNKTASAVELRFEAARSPHLSDYVKQRLAKLAGQKWTKDGAIVIRSEKFRHQAMNRDDALQKLIELINKAAYRPKRRIKTKPSRAAKARRMDQKTQRGALKKSRGKITDF